MIRKVFPVIGLTVFSVMLGMGILNPILPIYAKDVGATGVWIGFISGGYAVSRAVLTPFIGRWSDRKGRKIFLGSGLFAYALISLLYVLAENLPFLFAVRLLHGAVSGMILPVARAWIGDISPRGEEGRWQGYFNTALFSGSATGPFLGGTLTDLINIDAAFAVMGFMNLLSFIAVAVVLREGTERKPSERQPLSFRKLSASPMFQGLFLERTALEISLSTFTAFLPLFAYLELGISRSYIGFIVGGALFITSWLQLVTGRLADRFDRRRIIIFAGIIAFTAMALIPFSKTFAVMVGLVFLRSTCAAVSMPASSAISVNLGRQFGMGSTIALFALATSIGMGVGPISAGFIYDYLGGISSVFYFCAAVGLIGISIFAWLSHKAEIADKAIKPSAAPSEHRAAGH
ncbi:MAG: MFS transporter [Chloroflexota bacterium]